MATKQTSKAAWLAAQIQDAYVVFTFANNDVAWDFMRAAGADGIAAGFPHGTSVEINATTQGDARIERARVLAAERGSWL